MKMPMKQYIVCFRKQKSELEELFNSETVEKI